MRLPLSLGAVEVACAPGGVRAVAQPLVRLVDGTVAGYEALGRVTDGQGCGPAEWLDAAELLGRRVELELAFLRAAAVLGRPPAGVPLFVNVSAATLVDPRFQDVRDTLPLHVLELSEHDRIDDYAQLLPRLRAWQRRGSAVAVDDVGAGYANMTSVLELRPTYVKIDRSLVSGLDGDPRRRAVVTALHVLASASGAQSVAEGVERPEELAVLREVGVDLAQGYLLARPGDGWPVPGDLASSPAPQVLDVHSAADAHSLARGVVAALTRDPELLPSVYLARGGRLRCIARHGQSLVLDGIEGGIGLTGTAFARDVEVLVEDVSVDPRYRQSVPGVRSEIAVPLRLSGAVVGVLNVDALRPLEPADVASVRRAARAIEERLAVVGVGAEHDSVLLRLGRVTPDVARAASLTELAQLSVRAAVELGDFDTAALWEVKGSVPTVSAVVGEDAELLAQLSSSGVTQLHELVEAMASCYSGGQDLAHVQGAPSVLSAAGVRAMCAVPLRDGRRLIGFLLATRRTGTPAVPGELVQALELLCLQVGSRSAALTHVAELTHSASRDPLTGIANRSVLDALLDDGEAGSAHHGRWLAVLDLDGFKAVNDHWGHAAGDEVLRAVANALEVMTRGGLAVRLGGDEFAVLVDAAESSDAETRCEDLRRGLTTLLQPYGADVSVGLAAVTETHGLRDALVHADEALYLRKRSGGGGVTLHVGVRHLPVQARVALDRRTRR